MSMHKVCTLGSPTDPPNHSISPTPKSGQNKVAQVTSNLLGPGSIIRLNLPNVHLKSLVFSKDKPYFYVINETHVEKYSYHINI